MARESPLRSPVALALACAAYEATYFLTTAIRTPLLWYYPLEHRFALERTPQGLAVDFYGRVLWCTIAALATLAVGARVTARQPEPSRWTAPALAWATAIALFTAGLHVYLLLHRTPIPVALPSGYAPR